jgi:predicted ATPase
MPATPSRPLALELAAARVGMLSIGQITDRLEDRFGLLTRGGRTAPPRQQTLRATMDRGYDLLSESERVLFERLPVFAGGFSLEEVEEVCAGDGIELKRWEHSGNVRNIIRKVGGGSKRH